MAIPTINNTPTIMQNFSVFEERLNALATDAQIIMTQVAEDIENLGFHTSASDVLEILIYDWNGLLSVQDTIMTFPTETWMTVVPNLEDDATMRDLYDTLTVEMADLGNYITTVQQRIQSGLNDNPFAMDIDPPEVTRQMKSYNAPAA